MNEALKFNLKLIRKIYLQSFMDSKLERPKSIGDPHTVARIIQVALTGNKPCMIARFGANELSCLANYLGVHQRERSIIKYIKGETLEWWWNQNIIKKMHEGAGFFPARIDKIEQFCQLMLEDIPLVDILGSWLPGERYFEEELKHAKKVQLLSLDPYWATEPWTRALEGKKVLVVHPFSETIKTQYQKRKHLFSNNLLPAFELKTIKAVQSIAGEKTPFADWFDALDYMKEKINQTDYDICLIGAGAYGFPLAAHVKRMGKKGFHLGGSLQLLFGIRGKRWESPDYHHTYNYPGLVNKYWVSPNEQEKPTNANKVEGGCYW
tara:strand:+ start:3522 stop:4487 length:966 start_codon:yes stop_codon:yes gene_type:complete